jgi:hypothetical protein
MEHVHFVCSNVRKTFNIRWPVVISVTDIAVVTLIFASRRYVWKPESVGDIHIKAFWNIAYCSLLEADRRFRGAVSIIGVMEAVNTYETLMYYMGLHKAISLNAVTVILSTMRN